MSSLHTDKWCELVELYALGGLSEEEKVAFKRHVEQCADCRSQLDELEALVDLLPMASEAIEVPKGMRDRVLGRVLSSTAPVTTEAASMAPRSAGRTVKRSELHNPDKGMSEKETLGSMGERSRRTMRTDRKTGYWRLMSIGLSVAVIVLCFYGYQLKDNMKQLQSELASAANELKAAQNELIALNKPVEALKVNQIVNLNPAAENVISKGLATIVIDDKGTHLIVQAENLPELQKDQAFQVWLIKDNQPINAGTFYPQNGSGAIYYTFEPNGYDTVAITLEPDAHGEKPRGSIVLAAGIKS